jgi:hypothetical protein
MPVRKGPDSFLCDFRFVFFDAGTLDDYFAVFLLAWLRVCCGLLCRFYDGVARFPGRPVATLVADAFAGAAEGNIW